MLRHPCRVSAETPCHPYYHTKTSTTSEAESKLKDPSFSSFISPRRITKLVLGHSKRGSCQSAAYCSRRVERTFTALKIVPFVCKMTRLNILKPDSIFFRDASCRNHTRDLFGHQHSLGSALSTRLHKKALVALFGCLKCILRAP